MIEPAKTRITAVTTNGLLAGLALTSLSDNLTRAAADIYDGCKFMYGVTTGIFAFLVAIVFGAWGARERRGPGDEAGESHPPGSSGSEGRRIKKLKSDGTPVYK
jgi:hypothetical protein